MSETEKTPKQDAAALLAQLSLSTNSIPTGPKSSTSESKLTSGDVKEEAKDSAEATESTGSNTRPSTSESLEVSTRPGTSESKESKDKPEEPKEEKKEDDRPSTQDSTTSSLIKSSYEVKVKLADIQADPNSPLFSAKSFEDLGLSDELLKGLYAMKFSKPSKIQEKALPLLLSDPPRNMIGQSQSGTGKTAAFSLTMLSRVDENDPSLQAICLAPARELARQTMDVVTEMGKYTKVKTQLVVPGSLPRNAGVNAQIAVGTPGLFLDMIRRKKINLSHVKVFVLDEADNMLDQQGMGDQCVRVKRSLPAATQLFRIETRGIEC
ncbi:unnamed protein product [Ambrosiozyma monospora]|uniref:ATP-dependent RNA helicase n=1 Tax=Ambrosiozyma monospora TaxID=43982 RepID=A0A9W7DII4_AMBMO|nr:unnamed protein product [Ambrosiozyma monospora]